MSYAQNKSIARRFIQEVFNEGKIEDAKKLLTPDIVYQGVFEEVRGLEEFKQWIAEDRRAFPDAKFTVVDEFGEQNKVAIRWIMKATHEKDIAGLPASHEKFDTHGADIFHFKGDKIKEAWTIFDALTPALQLGIVEKVQQVESKK